MAVCLHVARLAALFMVSVCREDPEEREPIDSKHKKSHSPLLILTMLLLPSAERLPPAPFAWLGSHTLFLS